MLKRLAKRFLERMGMRRDFLADARTILGDAPGLVLFDVGANIGQTIRDMQARFNQPQIYSFEPSPKTFAQLKFPGVTLENLALGDVPGELPFHTDTKWSVNDSLLKPVHQTDGETVTVLVDTVDAYCEKRGLERIDLLKIDAQGYDIRVLQGAKWMLAQRSIRLVSAEVNFVHMYEGQPPTSALFALAESFGYRVKGVYPGDWWDKQLAHINVLFEAPH